MLHQSCSHELQGLQISQEVPCLGGCPWSWSKVRVHTDGEPALSRGFHAGVSAHGNRQLVHVWCGIGTQQSMAHGLEKMQISWEVPLVNGV